MDNTKMKDMLIQSLTKIYYMEAFQDLTEFLQGEQYVLHFLSENKDVEITPSYLSDMLHISRPRVTAAINTLRSKGYVMTTSDNDDRRKQIVIITEEGLSFIEGKKKKVEGYFLDFVERLGKDDSMEFFRLINKIVSNVEED